jgi:HK97 gp10 family phage protein
VTIHGEKPERSDVDMASAKMSMPEDFLLKISNLGDKTDVIIPKILETGGEVVAEQVKSNLQSSLSGKSSGQLLSALGVSGARLDRNGNFNVKIGFAENRNDGKSNAMLASILEHGKHNQPPRPFMRPARTQSRKAAIAAVVQAFEDEVNKL